MEILLILVSLFFLAPFVIGTYQGIKGVFDDKKIAQEQKEMEEKREQDAIVANIYKKCQELKINPHSSAEDRNKLMVVARSYGVDDLEEAKRLYYLGKKVNEAVERAKFQEIRNKEKETYERQKKDTEFFGKRKYVAKCIANLQLWSKLKGYAEHSINQADRASNMSNDWAFWAGIANGIAGPGAGLAIGADIKQMNERNKQNARNAYNELSVSYRDADEAMKKCAKVISKVDSKLIDDSTPEEFFKSLQFTDVSINVTEGGNFLVRGKINIKDTFDLLGKECILDGSLEIVVLDETKTVVGKGYYSAPGKDSEYVWSMGFEDKMRFDALCWADFYDKYMSKRNYTCEIKPYKMWKIEI